MLSGFSVEPTPLCEDIHGDIRVGNSRVLLDLIVHAFDDGATPETIVQMYPTLQLADVYAVIAYYLRHRQQIQDYLEARGRRGEETRRLIQLQQSEMQEIRQRLLQRRADSGKNNVASAE